MLVLPVLLISFNNDNGSKSAKGTSFLISSATFGGSLSAFGADIKCAPGHGTTAVVP